VQAKLLKPKIFTMKKSRFQKAREDKELKKKLDDEEAAKGFVAVAQNCSIYLH
jgi:hypothetical protein